MDNKDPFRKIEEQVCFILMKAGVILPDVDKCMDWAFGHGAWYVAPCEWVARWNKLHPGFNAAKNVPFVDFIYKVGLQYLLRHEVEMNDKRSREVWHDNVSPPDILKHG